LNIERYIAVISIEVAAFFAIILSSNYSLFKGEEKMTFDYFYGRESDQVKKCQKDEQIIMIITILILMILILFHSDRIRLYRESPQENGMEGNGNDALQIRKKYQDYVAENISLEILKERYPYQRELLDQLAELMVDVLCSTKDHICVGKEDKPAPIVKAQFMKINSMHIEYVLEGLQKKTTLVRNTRQYLITTLYNAPLTIDAHYDTLFNHDRANGLI
jgi:hypothetical protein